MDFLGNYSAVLENLVSARDSVFSTIRWNNSFSNNSAPNRHSEEVHSPAIRTSICRSCLNRAIQAWVRSLPIPSRESSIRLQRRHVLRQGGPAVAWIGGRSAPSF